MGKYKDIDKRLEEEFTDQFFMTTRGRNDQRKDKIKQFIRQELIKAIRSVELEDVMEDLADIEHKRWAGWQEYLHSKCSRKKSGGLTIPDDLVKRWERQIKTPYKDLSEKEKESDRKEVRRYFPLFKQFLHQEILTHLKDFIKETRVEERDMVGDDLKCNCDGENYCNCQFSENDGYNQALQDKTQKELNYLKKYQDKQLKQQKSLKNYERSDN